MHQYKGRGDPSELENDSPLDVVLDNNGKGVDTFKTRELRHLG